jgi:phage recombination protein Bet
MANPAKNSTKTRELIMPTEANQIYGLSAQSWNVLTEVTFPTAKTPEAILMALDYCKARKLDIFKKPVHIVPMWSSVLGRNVETVWPSIMEIQTTASRTGLWAGMDRPVWGPDVTQTFIGQFKDDHDNWQKTEVTLTFPEWVAVTVYRLVNGRRCAFTEEVYWLEAYSTAGGKNSQLPTAMWIKRPKGQLGKCGKAASLRSAFPEECGYAAEEMDGKSLDELNDGTVINGAFTQTDELPSIAVDLSQINTKVMKNVAELVRRTASAGAWTAGYEFARNRFNGMDLSYAIAELDKAAQHARAKGSNSEIPLKDTDVIPPGTTPASAAFQQARETLAR